MKHEIFNKFIHDQFSESKFAAHIGERGGYLTFSNSGQRGGTKYFTLSLETIHSILIDIQNNLPKFLGHDNYIESEWRDLGPAYYTDESARTLSTVQTKPLFSTISKMINWAINSTANPDDRMDISAENLTKTIESIEELIEEFQPIAAQSIITGPMVPFDVTQLVNDIASTNLRFQKELLIRFVGALIAKRFLILTGLSGSGKTKIAEAFALWMHSGKDKYQFSVRQKIEGSRSTYMIEDTDRLGVMIRQEGSDTKAFLPHDLIDIWRDVIEEKGFDASTPSQEIQGAVLSRGIEYSPTLNSFHSPLKALAINGLLGNQEANVDHDQYCLVAVGADWTNREPLLGFPNALNQGEYVKPDNGALDLILNANKNASLPYFLILDEMNMSHVERYFADFLSGMEATKGKIELHPEGKEWQNCDVPASVILPNNLFIIGTVNIDETTYMFSPKVLDRANVIEFRVTENEMTDYLKAPMNPDVLSIVGKGALMGKDFVKKSLTESNLSTDLGTILIPFFSKLKDAGAEFGYRTASEINRFISVCTDIAGDVMEYDEIIDAAIMQKLLPKLHGSRNKIEKILRIMAQLCLVDENKEPFLEGEEDIKYPLSYEKLKRMHKRVRDDGFTSYAEA